MREAVSIKIISQLLEEGANIVVYNPAATNNAKKIFGNRIRYSSSATECIRGADCCMLVTEWDEFKKLKPEDFIQNMRQPILVDGRRIHDPKEFGRKQKLKAIGLRARNKVARVNSYILITRRINHYDEMALNGTLCCCLQVG